MPQLDILLDPFSPMIQGVIQCATIACAQGMLGANLEYSFGNLYMMRSGDATYACVRSTYQPGQSTVNCTRTEPQKIKW